MGSRDGTLGLAPGSKVSGRFRPGGSKSLAQRALLAAALARGTTAIEGLSDAEDVRAALGVLARLGVLGDEDGGAGSVAVAGRPPGTDEGLVARGPVELGESGTLARLATAALALAGRPGERFDLVPRGTLATRRSPPLFAALRAALVELAHGGAEDAWPVALVARTPRSTVVLADAISSQEASGLALALAAHEGERELVIRGRLPSAPYFRMTLGLLGRFGARAEVTGELPDELRVAVRGPLRAPEHPLEVEPDASSAAVALAAACLSGGALEVPGLGPDSLQGDVRVVAHLAAFGCDARHATHREGSALAARGFPRHGATLDLGGEPDLAPVLAAVAAAAALRHGAASVLTGLGTLPGKESDRLAGLARALATLGLVLEAGADSLRIAPGPAHARTSALVLDPHGDHRMAFAFALLGLVVPNVLVRDPRCVAKSWSGFWEDLETLGATVQRG